MRDVLKYSARLCTPTLALFSMGFTQYVANVYTNHSCETQLWCLMSSFSLKNSLEIQKSSKLRVKTTSVSSEKSKVALSYTVVRFHFHCQPILTPSANAIFCLSKLAISEFSDLPHATSKHWNPPRESIPRSKVEGTYLFFNTHRPSHHTV